MKILKELSIDVGILIMFAVLSVGILLVSIIYYVCWGIFIGTHWVLDNYPKSIYEWIKVIIFGVTAVLMYAFLMVSKDVFDVVLSIFIVSFTFFILILSSKLVFLVLRYLK